MGSLVPDLPELHRETPCIPSPELSRVAGCNIYLKLENLQPSGSFKSRGIGALMGRALLTSSTGRAHFYCSSGGNAGLACAEAARTLRQPCDVFVWCSTPDHVLDKLAALGATPHRVGNGWPEADAYCRAAMAANPDGVYVPPFDHPLIWEGNATLVNELAALEAKGFFGGGGIDAIVCNVGGGGLLNGVMEGIERNYGAFPPSPPYESDDAISHHRPAVLALETSGADSMAASIRAGEHTTIPLVTSIASSLGAPRVAEQTYRWIEACKATTFTYTSNTVISRPVAAKPVDGIAVAAGGLKNTTTRLVSAVVPDADAVSACVRFLEDTRLLVEVACGATLAGAYSGSGSASGPLLRTALSPDADDERWACTNVVLVVCGGSNISMEMLAKYRVQYGV
ncbi:putative L-serine dehydratase [Rosellinia necatrix]|uniref:L-serine ammonia-lyase n=1 Tax=Rosellinia necatrix TaxID=77044 RepID=A0A1W2THN3_ROSNE|nr:putative L-serine dehydratase [Rosellinia necatrix]